MLEIIRLILGFIITVLVGWLLLRFILSKEKRPFYEELALSYGLGIGVIALEFVIFWFLNIKATLINILLPWLVMAIYLVFIKRIPLEITHLNQQKEKYSLFEVFLLSGLSLEIFLSFFRALIKPLESFDSISIYAIRAKIFYQAGGIPKEFFSKITNAFPNSAHPLMVPLAENWVYTFLGAFNDFLVKAIFPLYLVAFLILFYFALRELFDRKRAILFTFLLASIPQFNRFSTKGYADFILTFYFTGGFLYLFYWMKNKKTPYLILSALFIAFSCWTKMEGWALFLSTAIILLIFAVINSKEDKKVFFKLGIFILVVLLIGLPWIFLISTTQLEDNALQLKTFGLGRLVRSFLNFDRLPRIIYEFQRQFFGPKKWNIIWIVSLSLFILDFKSIFKNNIKYITLLLILIMVGYGYTYLVIPLKEGESLNWIIGSGMSRLFIHFTPLCVFWLAYLCKKKKYI